MRVEIAKAAKLMGGEGRPGQDMWVKPGFSAHVYLEKVSTGPPRAADTAA